MVYKFKIGARVPAGSNPTKVAETLNDIHSRYGVLSAKTVADDVEVDGIEHPLGNWFTWDPELGMRKLHEIEAGTIIRSVTVEELKEDQTSPVRAYVKSMDEEGFDQITDVLLDANKRQDLISQMREEKRQLDLKWDEILELMRIY